MRATPYGTGGREAAPPPSYLTPRVDPDALAFLQYTSSSTGDPKGVAVSHRNLTHNERVICEAFLHIPDSLVVGRIEQVLGPRLPVAPRQSRGSLYAASSTPAPSHDRALMRHLRGVPSLTATARQWFGVGV